MAEETAIVEISAAQFALDRTSDIYEMRRIGDIAEAAALFAERQGLEEVAQKAKILQLKANRKAGEWLKENVDRGSPELVEDYQGLPEGFTKKDAYNLRLEASLPEEKFNEWIDQNLANGWEISAAGLRKVAANKTHVSFNTGESEWYTPPEYIIAATAVMGRIDLDPASSEIANQTVGATVFYTRDDDGLDKFWAGKVWMNPPYSTELITRFVRKFTDHVIAGDISEGIVFVNNATETEWFGALVKVSKAIVFPFRRVKFLDPQGNPGAPLQGQAILYAGPSPECFIQHFEGFGWSARLK